MGRDRLHRSERPPKLTVSPLQLRWRLSSGMTYIQGHVQGISKSLVMVVVAAVMVVLMGG